MNDLFQSVRLVSYLPCSELVIRPAKMWPKGNYHMKPSSTLETTGLSAIYFDDIIISDEYVINDWKYITTLRNIEYIRFSKGRIYKVKIDYSKTYSLFYNFNDCIENKYEDTIISSNEITLTKENILSYASLLWERLPFIINPDLYRLSMMEFLFLAEKYERLFSLENADEILSSFIKE